MHMNKFIKCLKVSTISKQFITRDKTRVFNRERTALNGFISRTDFKRIVRLRKRSDSLEDHIR